MAACASGSAKSELSPAQVEALRQSIARSGGRGASASPAPSGASDAGTEHGGAAGQGAATAKGTSASAPAPAGRDANAKRETTTSAASAPLPARPERERRARTALGPARATEEVAFVDEVGRYAFALDRAHEAGDRDRLVLIDVSTDPGLVIGEHDFDVVEDPGALTAASANGENASMETPIEAEGAFGPVRLERTLEIASDSGEPVLLAEIRRESSSVACGWWLRRRGTRFVCAPRLAATSTYKAVDGMLVETWQVPLPGVPLEERVSGASGRLFRIYGGQWREADEYHCLAWSLEDAMRDAGAPGLAAWQTAAVRQRVIAARHASDELDTDRALALLRDALSIDGCDSTAWRLLGRLEFERGRAARAAPALAVALSLTAGEPATMVDLADALAVLNTSSATGAASLDAVLEALESHGNTRAVVDDAWQRFQGRANARGLAIALYESFLERTSAEDPRLEAARRRASEQVASMRRDVAPVRATSAKKPPAKSAKSAPSAKAAKPTKAAKAKKTGPAKGN